MSSKHILVCYGERIKQTIKQLRQINAISDVNVVKTT